MTNPDIAKLSHYQLHLYHGFFSDVEDRVVEFLAAFQALENLKGLYLEAELDHHYRRMKNKFEDLEGFIKARAEFLESEGVAETLTKPVVNWADLRIKTDAERYLRGNS